MEMLATRGEETMKASKEAIDRKKSGSNLETSSIEKHSVKMMI